MAIVLVGYDGSEPSRQALRFAVRRVRPEDEIVLLTVIPASVAESSLSGMMPAGLTLPEGMSKPFEARARERLDEAIEDHATSGARIRGEVRVGDASEVLVKAAAELDAEEVVIGHKSFERGDLKVGPVAESLVRLAGATVTVVRSRPTPDASRASDGARP